MAMFTALVTLLWLTSSAMSGFCLLWCHDKRPQGYPPDTAGFRARSTCWPSTSGTESSLTAAFGEVDWFGSQNTAVQGCRAREALAVCLVV